MFPKEAVTEAPAGLGEKGAIGTNWKNYTSLAGLAVLIAISAIMSPTFLSPFNIVNVATQIAAPGILAVGMTFVILTGGIDLSVGSLLALTGVIVAIAAPVIGWPLAVLLAILLGTVVGMFHGLCITRFKVPPFIVTLAGLSAYKGLALIFTSSASVPLRADFFDYLGAGRLGGTAGLLLSAVIAVVVLFNYLSARKKYGTKERTKKRIVTISAMVGTLAFGLLAKEAGGVPIQVLIFVVLFAIAWFALNKTVFGRELYAIGGNPEAARLAGVKVKRGLIIVYATAGFLASIAGLLVATRLGSGTPQVGTLGELDAIAAVVIGGTSLMGGVGTLGGTIIGVILIGILNNLLSLLNITADMQMVFKGAIILGAVMLDAKLSKK
ncbi:UNVERIFIED_CONTAM: D-xylose transport system permease protein [Brevibacillus sp. OAP136]